MVGLLAEDTLSDTAGLFNFERLNAGVWRGVPRPFSPLPRLPSRPLPQDSDRSSLNDPAVVSGTLPTRRQQPNQP